MKLKSNIQNRIIESIDLALVEGDGKCVIENIDNKNKFYFDNLLEMDGIKFEKPNTFSHLNNQLNKGGYL